MWLAGKRTSRQAAPEAPATEQQAHDWCKCGDDRTPAAYHGTAGCWLNMEPAATTASASECKACNGSGEYEHKGSDTRCRVCGGTGRAPAPSQEAQAAHAGADTDAARDVLAERRRQVEAEGWRPDQDDDYEDGQLSMAAACYATQGNTPNYGPPPDWPWNKEWWKPTDDRRNLVKAAALILADIERIDRAAIATSEQKGPQA
jgi:hypothetical protein